MVAGGLPLEYAWKAIDVEMTWFSQYAHPWLLLVALVPIALVAAYVVAVRRRRRRVREFTGDAGPRTANPGSGPRLRHLPIALAAMAVALLAVALAGPTQSIEIPRNRAVIMLAIDVSPSMKSTDVEPDRLTVAENAAKKFAQQLTPGVNLGLVAFGGNAELLVSPTPDHSATVTALGHLRTDAGTATGAAIFAALQAIQTVSAVLGNDGASAPPARIVLLSDGAENRPANPDNPAGAYTAARSAKTQGVPISTVALGTKVGYVELDDQSLPVPVDDTMMKQIASLSEGQTSSASDVDALNRSYAAVAQQIGHQTERGPGGAKWLRLGAAFFIAAVLSSLLINRRAPV